MAGKGHKIKGMYMVYKVFKKSMRRRLLHVNLEIDEAKRIVRTYPDSSRSMVCFTKQ